MSFEQCHPLALLNCGITLAPSPHPFTMSSLDKAQPHFTASHISYTARAAPLLLPFMSLALLLTLLVHAPVPLLPLQC
jgi:hypothetical protein